MRIPPSPLIAATLPVFLQTTLAAILQQCAGSHNLAGFVGNTFFINVDQIDPAAIDTACSRCGTAIEDFAHGLGIMTGAVDCRTEEGSGAMKATLRLEGQAWTQQIVAIQDGLSACVGPLGVVRGCPCFGGC